MSWLDRLELASRWTLYTVAAFVLVSLTWKEIRMSHKDYGRGSKEDRRMREVFTFTLWGTRDDEEESHLFSAVWKPDTMLMARMMMAGDDLSAEEIARMLRMIGKTLDNTDGVKETWRFEELPPPKNAGKNYEPKFRGPDGKLYAVNGPDREKFEDYDAGSSRRRWSALVMDDEFQVEPATLAAIAKDLIEAGTGRPTTAR